MAFSSAKIRVPDPLLVSIYIFFKYVGRSQGTGKKQKQLIWKNKTARTTEGFHLAKSLTSPTCITEKSVLVYLVNNTRHRYTKL